MRVQRGRAGAGEGAFCLFHRCAHGMDRPVLTRLEDGVWSDRLPARKHLHVFFTLCLLHNWYSLQVFHFLSPCWLCFPTGMPVFKKGTTRFVL